METKKRLFSCSCKVGICVMMILILVVSPCIGAEDPAKFPSRPITMIIQWAPGGTTDLTGRKLAELAGKILGQPIIVENKAGGGGVIGTTAIAKAAPDGYTFGTATYSPNVVIPHLRSIPYNTKEDFTWMMQYADYTFIFSVLADSRVKTFKDLLDEARKNPGKLNYATHGPNTAQHLYMEKIFSMEKVKLNHVPLGGGAELVPQILGGHLDAGMAAELAPHVKSGKLRGIATQAQKRFEMFPEVPTFYELGYQIDAPTWFGLCAPKGVDPPIMKKLTDALQKACDDPSFKALCNTLFLTVNVKALETFRTIVFRDYDNQLKILKELGLVK